MLHGAQRTLLEEMVQSVDADLHLETATLDANQTLELVLCREFVCFRPLRIDGKEVNIPAALEGQTEAQEAFKVRLQAALKDLL
jgi:hypothetical protein